MTGSNRESAAPPFSPSSCSYSDPATRKSMEEVWKEISLPSLHDHPPTSNPPFNATIFQNLLALPANKNTDPLTILSLNFGSDFSPLQGSDHPLRPNPQLESHDSSQGNPFDLAPSSVFHSSGKKRVSENNDNCSDRRYKRMMKNRESAARSRARRQAYTTELELKVRHLKDENARLRRQQERMCLGVPRLPKKRTLFRTLTAPF